MGETVMSVEYTALIAVRRVYETRWAIKEIETADTSGRTTVLERFFYQLHGH